ncbi:MAG: 2-oxoacid:acceptor oxidoreductase family protein, partial [Candidatus Woesearchaeota archaeon]|nr:2-oxoacid:acceptor oxidoreductase family protein [Candidatus Woesearchaeota archaeon]
GGQGAVTTGQIIAIAALYDKKYSQSFPMFGVERRGAPVEAFARIDKAPISIRSQVYNPDIVLVLDPTLSHSINVAQGIKEGGIIIINTSKKPKDIKIKEMKEAQSSFKVYTIDATSVALRVFKRPIVNTPILGAFSAITGLVSLKSLLKAVDERFSGKKEMAELNKTAIRELYEKAPTSGMSAYT